MFKNSLLVVFTFLIMSTAQAGLLFEPYVGMGFLGSVEPEVNAGAGTTVDDSYSTMNYGGRLGFTMAGLMLGGEYSMGSATRTTELSGLINSTTETELDATYIGAFIGYQLPVMFRVWATYYFSGELDDTAETDTNDVKIYSGTGTSFGLGYTGLPFVSLNVEYRMFTFDEGETVGGTTGPLTDNLETSDIFVSLSFPFSI